MADTAEDVMDRKRRKVRSSDWEPSEKRPSMVTNGGQNDREDVGNRYVSDRAYQWENINVMLNCISSMIDKTKRALSILQHSEGAESALTVMQYKQFVEETLKSTEQKLFFMKQKSEDAMNEVVKQAMMKLQAVSNGGRTTTLDFPQMANHHGRNERFPWENRRNGRPPCEPAPDTHEHRIPNVMTQATSARSNLEVALDLKNVKNENSI